MKVYIKKYPNWFGPYQVADCLRLIGVKEETRYELGYRLSKFEWTNKLANWWYKRRLNSRARIHIDKYDTWNMDHTLATIIHPMLVVLKNDKGGISQVDDSDVPDELKSKDHTNNDHIKRWHYVLDEMIWAFKEIDEDEWESKFFENGHDIAGATAHKARIQNGLRLFSTYYLSLWT